MFVKVRRWVMEPGCPDAPISAMGGKPAFVICVAAPSIVFGGRPVGVTMKALALAGVITAGLWLMAVALLMALRPAYSHYLCTKMTAQLERANWRVQFTEQGLRILAGVALIVRAPASKLPEAFGIAGWLLVASSVLILLAPIQWHGKYGALLMKRLTPSIIRFLSPVPAVFGAGLIYASI